MGKYNTMSVKTDGTLWAWGRNNRGQLGISVVTNRSSPIQVGASTNWSQTVGSASMSNEYTAAIKTDGTLYLWGKNNYGQLGLGDVVYRSSPVQLGSGTTWSQVSTSSTSTTTMAIKTDGTLWAWGSNDSGQLGTSTNSSDKKSSPVQVGTDTNWRQIHNSVNNNVAIKTDGTLWTWGYNGYGGLGTNNVVYRSSPVQVGTGTTWSRADVGKFTTAAVKTDGTLWLWGGNEYGVLGQNTNITKSSPTQVGALTNWSLVSMGDYNVMAIKTDGTLWVWGGNFMGQLGQNNRGQLVNIRSSPVQVGALTSWKGISAAQYSGVAIKA
jgi:alpha-tubulin suppressor-like RCC1 family protein